MQPGRPLPTRRASALLGLAGLAGLAVLLELLPRTPLVDPRSLPPLHEVLLALADQALTVDFWTALSATLRGWATGLAVAVLVGVVLGVVIGSLPWLRAATSSTIEFLRPIPSVALVPLVVLLAGTAWTSTLVLVVYASLWPVLVQVLQGVRDVDPVARETTRAYRFGAWRTARALTWPTATPYAVTGVRLAASVALVLEVTGELVIGSPGVGRSIAVAQSSGAYAPMYALVLVTGVLGVAVNASLRILERRVLRWHPAVRTEVPV